MQTNSNGESKMLAGQTNIERWSWHSLIYIRDGKQILVYLDDKTVPEFEATIEAGLGESAPWFFGGRTDNQDNWEGRLDEIAVFDRVLTPKDLKMLQTHPCRTVLRNSSTLGLRQTQPEPASK